MTNVVEIRPSPVSLNDIPNMLRKLADRFETGDLKEDDCCFAIVPQGGNFPIIIGFGDVDGQNDPIIQMERAKFWLIQNECGRCG